MKKKFLLTLTCATFLIASVFMFSTPLVAQGEQPDTEWCDEDYDCCNEGDCCIVFCGNCDDDEE